MSETELEYIERLAYQVGYLQSWLTQVTDLTPEEVDETLDEATAAMKARMG